MSRWLICGVDEAGRGPLAGPVFAACVMLNPQSLICGLADSKQLSAAKREQLTSEIKSCALAWAIASASVEEIDRLNILQASLLAMKRAVEKLSLEPAEVLVDGLHCPQLKFPTRAIVKGDCKIPEIMAASILAKTARDAEMLALHLRFPQYGFDRHKGYPTSQHLVALQIHGVSEIHRRSFAPVKALVKAYG
ncbi:MAG: ribonuclease HII [Burkholderiales bacterium]